MSVVASSSLFDQISRPVADDIDRLKVLIREAIASPYDILGPIASHLVEFRGKMMRPILGMLVARLHGEPNDQTYATAILFELLHYATLVHDDVIDEAYLRRGQSTLGSMLRSRQAVLVGDFLFTKGLTFASVAGAFAQIEIATRSIEKVVEGELAQSENVRKQNCDVDTYLNVARLKTATLLSGVAEACALSVGASLDQCRAMATLGDRLGLAFQIQDDILDYEGSGLSTGKVPYNDIREGKITFPLLLAIARGGDRTRVLRALRGADVDFVSRYVVQHDGVDMARTYMNNLCAEALSLLGSYPDSEYSDALRAYATYVASRNK